MEQIEKIEQEARKRKFPLLPYSQLVWEMQKHIPQVYSYSLSVLCDVPFSDCGKIKDAFKKAILNHPVLQTGIDENGLQYYKPCADIFHTPFLSLDFSSYEGKVKTDISASRLFGDAISSNILVEDFFRAYEGKPLEPDYYFAYLQYEEERKLTQKYISDRLWHEQQYANLPSVHPKPDIPLYAVENPVEGVRLIDCNDLLPLINQLACDKLISLTAFFSLVAALSMMDYNNESEAALTWAYDGREAPIEQRICGSLHRDVPMIIKAGNSRDDLFSQVRDQMRSGIAHSGYPFTLTPPNTDIWNFAVNVIYIPSGIDLYANAPFKVEVMPSETPSEQPASVLFDIELHEENGLQLLFRYSASHYSQQSINRFCCLVRKNAEWLLQTC